VSTLNLIAVWAVGLSAVEFFIAAVANAAVDNRMFALFYIGLTIVNGSLAIIQAGVK